MFKLNKKSAKTPKSKKHDALSQRRNTISSSTQLIIPGYSEVPGTYTILVQPVKHVYTGHGILTDIALISDDNLEKWILVSQSFLKFSYKRQVAELANCLLKAGERCRWLANLQCTSAGMVEMHIGGDEDPTGTMDGGDVYALDGDDATRQTVLRHNFGTRLGKKILREERKATDKAVKLCTAVVKEAGEPKYKGKNVKDLKKTSKTSVKAAKKAIAVEVKANKIAAKAGAQQPAQAPQSPLEAMAANIQGEPEAPETQAPVVEPEVIIEPETVEGADPVVVEGEATADPVVEPEAESESSDSTEGPEPQGAPA